MRELRRIAPLLLMGLVANVIGPQTRGAEDPVRTPSPDVTEPPAYEEFVVIPLRIHILSSKDQPDLDCQLSDADVMRILGKVNRIWEKAGVHWGLESLIREPAANQDQFRAHGDRAVGRDLRRYTSLFPEESYGAQVLNLYYIHEFSSNGVWLGRGAVVKDTARLRTVEGGIDEPIPRVSAHELGHALGLPHRQDRTNLLASGTTGTLLNADEVKSAREHALRTPGAAPVAAVRKAAEAAESAGDQSRALRLRTWLGEIPGAVAVSSKSDRQSAEPVPNPAAKPPLSSPP